MRIPAARVPGPVTHFFLRHGTVALRAGSLAMAAPSDIIPPTSRRVAARTADKINRRIRRQTEATVAYFADHIGEIDGRLHQLNREWDIERTLEANAATISFFGILLARRDRRLLALPALVAGFLFQHALNGWCPPVPILRSLGIRTAAEINLERCALKYLRGDFREEPPTSGPARARARHALTLVGG